MTTELVPAKMNEQAMSIDRIAAENQMVFLDGQQNGFCTALRVAGAINAMRQALTPSVMGSVMALQNSALGFLTDKPGAGYELEIVRDCLIEAVLRGARPFGNELNIISGRCYLTKSFYTRIVPDLPGVSEVDVRLSVPKLAGDKGAIVDCTASWKLRGVSQSLKPSPGKEVREIAVRVNSGMGTDAILGKATRKAYKAIHDQITGWKSADGDADDEIEGEFMETGSTKRKSKASKLNDPPAEGDGGLGERA